MSHDRFLDPLAKLFTALHNMEDPIRKERAIYFCIEKMIDFAIAHDLEPPENVEGMTEQ